VGCFYGIITRRKVDNVLCLGDKEDVERSIRYFIEDGIVLRFNKIAPKTKYYNVSGGLGTKKERLESMAMEAHKLQEAFPQYGKVKVRKNGLTEFNLNKIKLKRF
jgi:hypothetical protein